MTAPALPELIPQKHGGALYRGGVRGNAGNRVRSAIRSDAVRMVAERLPALGQIADGNVIEWTEDAQGNRVPTLASPTPGERTKAMSLLWDIANSHKKVSLQQVKARLKAQVAVIRETLPPEQADTLLAALADVWR